MIPTIRELAFVGVLATFSSTAFAAGPFDPNNPEQSKASIAEETAKLAQVLQGKQLVCTDASTGAEALKIGVKNDGSVGLSSKYGDGGDTLEQIQVGSVLLLVVTGPDADEGGAVIFFPSTYNLDNSYAFATVYSDLAGAGSSRNDGKRQQLHCQMK